MKNIKIILSFIIVFIFICGLSCLKNNSVPPNVKTPVTPADLRTEKLLQEKTEFDNAMKQVAATDSDFDGIINTDETKYGTSPTSADTDGDGLLDKDEIFIYHTNPLKADTDGDGKSDGYEVRHGTSPTTTNK